MTKISTWKQRGKPADQRFDEKVLRSDGCWFWQSAKNVAGYGIFWLGGGRSVSAHRYSWERANGRQIPAGLVVMHECNNKGCVNPRHLKIGTAKENSEAAVRDLLVATGEDNKGGGKLTAAQAKEIYLCKTDGCQRLARKYGVSSQTVKAIRRGQLWRCATQTTNNHNDGH